MSFLTPDNLAFEKVAIELAQAATQTMAQNLEALQWLNRITARLEDQIMDFVAALETVSQARKELLEKNKNDFEQARSLSEVVSII